MFLNKKQYKYFKYKLKYNSLKNSYGGESNIELTLTSKEEKEFKVDIRVAIMSETVKSMLGIDSEEDINEAPEAAIPLPAVEGNILQSILKYLQYQ